nr:MAG TPA: hypothetical protein [Caudoviricetes sp.]
MAFSGLQIYPGIYTPEAPEAGKVNPQYTLNRKYDELGGATWQTCITL